MTNVEKFLEYQTRWSEAAVKQGYDCYEKIADEGLEWRDKNFTKSDWEELISRSYGRAKYEYTKRMKELFPE